MKDTTPDDALGYIVVSLPDRGEWQGFFVLPGYEQRGQSMLRDVREANQQPGMRGGTQINHGLPGLTDADQVAVGSLSAVLACRATPGNQPQATSGTHPLGIAFHPDWVNTTKV